VILQKTILILIQTTVPNIDIFKKITK